MQCATACALSIAAVSYTHLDVYKRQDYGNRLNCPRPGHSDYTAYVKYNASNDIRGGGHFSGRLTAVSYTHLDVYKRQV